jgi:phosphatidylglycerol---prolipoprotein diacylglyceryl transferase
MYPYIQIGPVVLGTYGIILGLAFVCAWKVLQANLRRHNLEDRLAADVVLLLGLSGIVGSKLYHVLETPSQLLAHPFTTLFGSGGFAWFGGFLAGVLTLWLLARHLHVPTLMLMDLVSPSAALGYGIGRLGCLLAGDGDYGTTTSLWLGMTFPNGLVPTAEYVHPTPIYESLVSLLVFYYLWRASGNVLSHGNILARYLLLTGTARFLVEFIRVNPRPFLGLSNAQIVSLLLLVGAVILFRKSAGRSNDGTGQAIHVVATPGSFHNIRGSPIEQR